MRKVQNASMRPSRPQCLSSSVYARVFFFHRYWVLGEGKGERMYRRALGVLVISLLTNSALADKPKVAVFPPDVSRIRIAASSNQGLTDLLVSEVSESGRFGVLSAKANQRCRDAVCRSQVAKSSGADRFLTTKITRLGKRCVVTCQLFLVSQSLEESASYDGGCNEESLVSSLKVAIGKIVGGQSNTTPATDSPKGQQQTTGPVKLAIETQTPSEVFPSVVHVVNVALAKKGKKLGEGILPRLVSGNEPLQCRLSINVTFPRNKPTGQPWDGDNSAPDPLGTVVVGGNTLQLSKHQNTYTASWTTGLLLSPSGSVPIQATIYDADVLANDQLVSGSGMLSVGNKCSGKLAVGPHASIVLSEPGRLTLSNFGRKSEPLPSQAAPSTPDAFRRRMAATPTLEAAAKASLEKMAQVNWSVRNSSRSQRSVTLEIEIPGLTETISDTVQVKPGSNTFEQWIVFKADSIAAVSELKPSTIRCAAKDDQGNRIWTQTRSINIQPVQALPWGPHFVFRDLVAAWVTPHATVVRRWMSKHRQRFDGLGTARMPTAIQKTAQAVYDALSADRMSYLNSSITFGENQAQRIRLPSDSLKTGQMNCIDGSLLYASVYQNMGLKPVIILGPGLAFVGVRLGVGVGDILPIETTVTGKEPFERAVARGQNTLRQWASYGQVQVVDVADARQRGIVPFSDATH